MEWGINLYMGLEFWTFFSLKVRGLTYMQITLYAGIYGMLAKAVCWLISNKGIHTFSVAAY